MKIKIYQILIIFLLFFNAHQAITCPITGDTVVCENGISNYTSVTTGAGFSYQWTPFGGISVGSGATINVNWGTSGAGQLSLIVRNNLNQVVCTSLLNVKIKAAPKPSILPSYSAGCTKPETPRGTPNKERNELNCFNVCDSTWITYSTINHLGSSYAWTINGAAVFTPSVTNMQSVYWTAIGVGTVKVIETDIYGCKGEAEICVNIVGRPNASFTTLPPPFGGIVNVCKGQQVQFINNSNAGLGSPLYSYFWDFGDGFSNNYLATCCNGNDTHTYNTPGTYTAMLIVENECHCKDTTFLTIVVSSTPGPKITCVSTVCPGSQVTYTTNAVCGLYNWSVNAGHTIIGSSTNQSVTVQWGSSGPGYLTLSTPSCAGFCNIPTTVQIPIIPPSATINGPTKICLNECVKYDITCNIPIDSIYWEIPPGLTVTTDTTNLHSISICAYNPNFTCGTIKVKYFHKIPGSTQGIACGGTASLSVCVKPKMNIFINSPICENGTLNINNFQPAPSGNLQYVITNIPGNITYYSNNISANTGLVSIPWTYGAGNFLLTINDLSNNYCNGPAKQSIIVNPKPPKPDSILGAMLVCPNSPYLYLGFATASKYILSWQAQNGVPMQGAGTSFAVTWGPSGPYSLALAQTDPKTGCKSDTIQKTISSILPLSTSTITGPSPACANTVQSYGVTDPGTLFTWSISPSIAGSVASGQGSQNIQILWNNYTGPVTLTLTRTACGSSIVSTKSISINAPIAPIINPLISVCQGTTASFSTPTIGATFLWKFGDGFTGTGASVTHVYNTSGNFVVQLIATYTLCGDTISRFSTININPKPNVSISTPDPNIFCGPIGTVNMFVSSPITGMTFKWVRAPGTFLNNGTTHSNNIIGSYYAVGTNSFGCFDTSNIIRIDTLCVTCRPNPNFVVDFNKFKTTCNRDSFVGTFTTGASSPTWNFDDPYGVSLAFGNPVTHQFTEPGFYRVSLCVNVPNVTNTDSCRICKIKVDTINYKPNFTDSFFCISGIDSLKLKLINLTKKLSIAPTPPYAWSINGGPTLSTATNPIFTLAPGTYNITLTVDGTCAITKTYTVPGFPKAIFTAPDSICIQTPLPLTNTSTGTFTNVLWNFGDGASSLVTNPVRAYSSIGLFNIKLVIANQYGCRDSFNKNVRVLPNNLTAIIALATTTPLCEGDSVQIISTVSSGYPAYSYLWNTTQITPLIWAKFTGNFYLDVTDKYGCFRRSNAVNVLVNPTPRPKIDGPKVVCIKTSPVYSVNYPNTTLGGYTLSWTLNGSNLFNNQNNYSPFVLTPGSNTLTVEVISPTGCIGRDTFIYNGVSLPNASIITSGVMCAGVKHLLIGQSTSTNVLAYYWNNGSINDSLYTSLSDIYEFTVIDSNGCKESARTTVHPLPNFCGVQTGCYEICDTIKKLVWYAPKGYAQYQWLFNGSPILGANFDTIHIPLYQNGTYNIVLTTSFGCKDTSDDIKINFVQCGNCIFKAKPSIICGPLTSAGFSTYYLTLQINNSLGAGAGISISSPDGTVTAISPSILAAGLNTITATFTDIPPVTGIACFNIAIFTKLKKCDTTICIELPPCEGNCTKSQRLKSIKCAGYDGAGNPMYYMCVDVNWGGSNASSVVISTPSGTMSPNTFTINNGNQIICATYTDLPPYSNFATFYFSYYDPIKQIRCLDSIKVQYEKCPKPCEIGVFGICAHCVEKTKTGWMYDIDLTINNNMGNPANVTITNIVGGIFGSPSPAVIATGMQNLSIPFTDTGSRDSIICFRVILNVNNLTCYRDICVFLPDCEKVGINRLEKLTYFSVYPNPVNNQLNIDYNVGAGSKNTIEVMDMTGKIIHKQLVDNGKTHETIAMDGFSPGVYHINFVSAEGIKGSIKVIKQ